jgi:antitoxin PrlF
MEYYFGFQCNTGMQMGNTLTVKGQVTIPKRVRDTLGLAPGDEVDFEVDEQGAVFLRRAARTPAAREPDGIDRARGSFDYKWGSTAEYMKFIRGDDYEINGD